MVQSFAGGVDQVAGIGRHVEYALAAGLDDAESGGIASAAFIGAGSEADTAGDDGMTQSALGIVVGRWQAGIEDESDHGIPVVEDLAREGTDLVLDLVSIALAVPLQSGEQPLDGSVTGAGGDLLDEAAQITCDLAAEGGAGAVATLGERHRLSDNTSRPKG